MSAIKWQKSSAEPGVNDKHPVSIEEVDELAVEISAALELLQRIGFRVGNHYVQDRVVYGFLWQAVAAAEVLFDEFTKTGHPYGLWPVLRQLPP